MDASTTRRQDQQPTEPAPEGYEWYPVVVEVGPQDDTRNFGREWRLRRTPQGKVDQIEKLRTVACDWLFSQDVEPVEGDPSHDGRWEESSWSRSKGTGTHAFGNGVPQLVAILTSPDGDERYYSVSGIDGWYRAN